VLKQNAAEPRRSQNEQTKNIMHIGIITPSISANEHDWCIPALRHLVRHLAPHCNLRVVAIRYPFTAGTYPLFGAQVHAMGGAIRRKAANLQLWQTSLATIRRLHREQPFDVLHAFWATESGALAAIAARMLGIPLIVTIAGGELARLPDAAYGGQLVFSERVRIAIALRYANTIAAGSDWACAMVPPTIGKPVIRLPLGIDRELFWPGNATQRSTPARLVHAASLVPVKDQATLLRALALVQQQGIPFVAELAGEGILDARLQTLANELGLTTQVRFRGAIDHDQLPAFFRGATAFLLSSLHESQCMAVLEAAACGIPTIGTAVGVVPELAPEAAIALPLRDPQAMANAICSVLQDQQRQQAMAQAALQQASAWDIEACVQHTLDVYRQHLVQ
jgi:glycosyltransferase involved in cell wall biosynthesis